jgi:hypothetical protein
MTRKDFLIIGAYTAAIIFMFVCAAIAETATITGTIATDSGGTVSYEGELNIDADDYFYTITEETIGDVKTIMVNY